MFPHPTLIQRVGLILTQQEVCTPVPLLPQRRTTCVCVCVCPHSGCKGSSAETSSSNKRLSQASLSAAGCNPWCWSLLCHLQTALQGAICCLGLCVYLSAEELPALARSAPRVGTCSKPACRRGPQETVTRAPTRGSWGSRPRPAPGQSRLTSARRPRPVALAVTVTVGGARAASETRGPGA